MNKEPKETIKFKSVSQGLILQEAQNPKKQTAKQKFLHIAGNIQSKELRQNLLKKASKQGSHSSQFLKSLSTSHWDFRI